MNYSISIWAAKNIVLESWDNIINAWLQNTLRSVLCATLIFLVKPWHQYDAGTMEHTMHQPIPLALWYAVEQNDAWSHPPPNLLPDGFLPGRDVRGVCENWDNMGGSFQPAGRVTVGSDWVRRTSIGVDIEPLWRTGSTWMGVCVSPSQLYFWSYTGNREPFSVNEGANQDITTSRLVTPNNTPPKMYTLPYTMAKQTMLSISQFTEAIRHWRDILIYTLLLVIHFSLAHSLRGPFFVNTTVAIRTSDCTCTAKCTPFEQTPFPPFNPESLHRCFSLVKCS